MLECLVGVLGLVGLAKLMMGGFLGVVVGWALHFLVFWGLMGF